MNSLQISENDKKNQGLIDFLGRINIRYIQHNPSFTIWVENDKLVDMLNEYSKITLMHPEDGQVSLLDLLTKVLFVHWSKTYEHIIIEDTKEESLNWEYPESKVMIASVNWFLSLAVALFEQQGWNQDELIRLSKKYEFDYEVIK